MLFASTVLTAVALGASAASVMEHQSNSSSDGVSLHAIHLGVDWGVRDAIFRITLCRLTYV